MQTAIDLIHEAAFGPKGRGSVPQTLTVTPEGRIILSEVGRKPNPKSVAAAQALLGPNVEVVAGTTSTNAPGPAGDHAEQRGGLNVPPGSRQASTHYACDNCAAFQQQNGIKNVTGTAADHGGQITRFPLQ
jgi:hypothetical protein